MNKKIIILTPEFSLLGGVSSFVRSLKGKFPLHEVYCFRGSYPNGFSKYFYFMKDFLFFFQKIIFNYSDSIILINTSMNKKAHSRDNYFFILCNLIKKDFFIFIHGWDQDYFNTLKSFELSKIFVAKKIFVLSESFKFSLLNNGYRNKVIVESTAVDDSFSLNFSAPKTFIAGNNLQILFIGRLEKEKGLLELLDVYPKLKAIFPQISLKIAGDGSLKKYLINWVEDWKGIDVDFVGFVDGNKKIDLFKSSDFFVLPSLSEGIPISLLESYFAGCISFVSQVGGIPSVFSEGKNGFSIQPNNASSIYTAFVNALASYETLNLISNFNYYQGKERFLSSQLAQRISKELI